MQVEQIIPLIDDALTGINPAKRDTLITTLLLLDVGKGDLRRGWLQKLTQGSARIDEELLLGLYATGTDALKLAIAASEATSHLDPPAFRRIFEAVFARVDISPRMRFELVWNLEHFLQLNPEQWPVYAHVAHELLQHSHVDLRIRATPLMALFGPINGELLGLLTRHWASSSSRIRLTTLNAFCHILDRLGSVSPEIRSVLASPAFREKVFRRSQMDQDADVQRGAANLLKRLKKAFGRTQVAGARPGSRRPQISRGG